jgi:hypothetical protein
VTAFHPANELLFPFILQGIVHFPGIPEQHGARVACTHTQRRSNMTWSDRISLRENVKLISNEIYDFLNKALRTEIIEKRDGCFNK